MVNVYIAVENHHLKLVNAMACLKGTFACPHPTISWETHILGYNGIYSQEYSVCYIYIYVYIYMYIYMYIYTHVNLPHMGFIINMTI